MQNANTLTLAQWFFALNDHLTQADLSRCAVELERECYAFNATPSQAACYARAYLGAENITPAEFAWACSLPLCVQAPELASERPDERTHSDESGRECGERDGWEASAD